MLEQTGLEKRTVDRASDLAKDRFLVAGQKAVDLANRTIEVVASSIQIDRDSEIILPSAFETTLPAFLAGTAALLAAHTHRLDDGKPSQVGWVMDGRIERELVRMRARLGKTDAAEEWWKLASDPDGKGLMVSIGFIPVRWVYGSVKDLVAEFPQLRKILRDAGLRDDDRLRVYTEVELLELSLVPVGSNRLAQQVRAAAKAFGFDDEGDTADLLDTLAEKMAERLAERMKKENLFPDLAAELETLKGWVLEQLEELKVLLPDPINPSAAGAEVSGAADAGKRAGADDGTKTEAAEERLLAAL